MKRFWENATVSPHEEGFAILLDGRPVKTPARRSCIVPTMRMAKEVAAEWQAQEDEVAPMNMPVTRSAITCLDRVLPEQPVVQETIASYGGTDLLCYRAAHPKGLVSRQMDGWDPVLEWAADSLGARLNVGEGIMHIEQPPGALEALSRSVTEHDAWRLTCLSELVTISGSLLLGLAVLNGHLDASAAWTLSRIDEQWNFDEWGEDHDAAEVSAKRQADFLNAERVLTLL